MRGATMVFKIPEENLVATRQEELKQIMGELIELLATNQLTEEEFAILHGYIYLAKEQLMKIDDVRFIIFNHINTHTKH